MLRFYRRCGNSHRISIERIKGFQHGIVGIAIFLCGLMFGVFWKTTSWPSGTSNLFLMSGVWSKGMRAKVVQGYELTETVRLPDIKVYFGPVQTTREEREVWVKYVQKVVPIASKWDLGNGPQKINGPEERARWVDIADQLEPRLMKEWVLQHWPIPEGIPEKALLMGHDALYCFPEPEEETPQISRKDYVKVRMATPKFRQCKNVLTGLDLLLEIVPETCPYIKGEPDFRPTWITANQHADSEIVVFHARDISAVPKAPSQMNKKIFYGRQKYVYFTRESFMNDCLYSPPVRRGIMHLFDALLGIIPSSDRLARENLLPGIQRLLKAPIIPLNRKIPGLLFAQSHCDTINGRYDVIARIKELGIRIIAPGRCLNENPEEFIKNDLSDRTLFMGQQQKFWDLCRGVLFYSAIENSNCHEYITEKLANAIYCDAIPLVYSPMVDGKRYPDYTDRMPEGTYLNIADFERLEELVQHMEDIAADEDLYRSYFWPKFISNHDQQNLVDAIATKAARGKTFKVNLTEGDVRLVGGCSWTDIASPTFRGGAGLQAYEDCIYRFQDLTARFKLTPYKIPLSNKRWWTREELKRAKQK